MDSGKKTVEKVASNNSYDIRICKSGHINWYKPGVHMILFHRDFDKEMTSAMELCILWTTQWLVPINRRYQYCSYLKLS